jgi:hypothetical protein
VIGLSNRLVAKLATGGEIDHATKEGLDRADESIQLARTLLERLAESIAPEELEELRQGGGL